MAILQQNRFNVRADGPFVIYKVETQDGPDHEARMPWQTAIQIADAMRRKGEEAKQNQLIKMAVAEEVEAHRG